MTDHAARSAHAASLIRDCPYCKVGDAHPFFLEVLAAYESSTAQAESATGADVKNAERYRWLRDNGHGDGNVTVWFKEDAIASSTFAGNDFDAEKKSFSGLSKMI